MPLDTWINQRTLFKVLTVSGRISSQPAVMPVFIFWQLERLRSQRCYFFPKIHLCIWWYHMTVTGLKNLWNSLHLDSRRMFRSYYWVRHCFGLEDLAVFDLFAFLTFLPSGLQTFLPQHTAYVKKAVLCFGSRPYRLLCSNSLGYQDF